MDYCVFTHSTCAGHNWIVNSYAQEVVSQLYQAANAFNSTTLKFNCSE